MTASYVLGIDLGTTNSVLAFAPLTAERPEVQLLPIPQLVAPGVVENRTSLPSFLYLAPEHEAAGGVFDLPWRKKNQIVVGELARKQSAENPQRTVVGGDACAGGPGAPPCARGGRELLRGESHVRLLIAGG